METGRQCKRRQFSICKIKTVTVNSAFIIFSHCFFSFHTVYSSRILLFRGFLIPIPRFDGPSNTEMHYARYLFVFTSLICTSWRYYLVQTCKSSHFSHVCCCYKPRILRIYRRINMCPTYY